MTPQLTEDGRRAVDDLAGRYGFSTDAVATMLSAVAAGHGTQAQFSHPEFGGMGQWSSGGMIMIGDMFNTALAGQVAALCAEIGALVREQPMFAAPAQSQSQSQGGAPGQSMVQGSSLFVSGGAGGGDWWPSELGAPGSVGAQNDLKYAYFPAAQRLAIQLNGATTVYDTGPHQIGGFSQQQGGDQSLTFTSQLGLVRVADLPVVSGAAPAAAPPTSFSPEPPPADPSPAFPPSAPPPAAPQTGAPQTVLAASAADDVFALIEKLAALHSSGVLTDAEFEAKKTELLSRI